jgi:hypothetical protein
MTGADHAYGKVDLDHDRYVVDRPPPAARFVALVVRNELLGCAEVDDPVAPDLPVDLALLPEAPLVRTVHLTATSAIDGKALESAQFDFMCYPDSEHRRGSMQMLMESDEQRSNPPLVHVNSLPVGTAVITVHRYDFLDDHLVADVPSGEEPLELTIALLPTGKAVIRGEVVDEEGHPVADVPLRLYRRSDLHPIWDQTERMPGRTDVAGHFELKALPAADYVVAVDPYESHRESGHGDRSPSDPLAPTAIVVAASESPRPCRFVLASGVACTLDVSFIDGVRRGVRLRALDGAGLPLIDDSNHYYREFWRSCGRLDVVIPRSATTLELTSRAGETKTIRFDPTLSTNAAVILPAK